MKTAVVLYDWRGVMDRPGEISLAVNEKLHGGYLSASELELARTGTFLLEAVTLNIRGMAPDVDPSSSSDEIFKVCMALGRAREEAVINLCIDGEKITMWAGEVPSAPPGFWHSNDMTKVVGKDTTLCGRPLVIDLAKTRIVMRVSHPPAFKVFVTVGLFGSFKEDT
jgi:hypothetical protein